MKILFAVNSEDVAEGIIKKYQKDYREIISYKSVYYFDAIQKEIQQDKSYDRVVISEELEPFSNSNYETMDKIIFEKLDGISDESSELEDNKNTIILICSDRHTKGSSFLIKLFGLGIYNALIGRDRSYEEVCRLIKKPRTKKEAKAYYQIDTNEVGYKAVKENEVSETEIQNIIAHFRRLGKNSSLYDSSFQKIASQYNEQQLKIIINCLPLKVKSILEESSPKYQEIMEIDGKIVKGIKSSAGKTQNAERTAGIKIDIIDNKIKENKISKPIVIPNTIRKNEEKKVVKVERKENEETISNKIQQELPRKRKISDLTPEERRKFLIARKKKALKKKIEESKAKIKTEVEKEVIKEDKEIANQNNDIENDNLLKKKRGRPRKTIEESVEKPKGKRGRPRKKVDEDKADDLNDEIQLNQSENNNIISDNNDYNEDVEVLGLDELDDLETKNDETIDLFDENNEFDDFQNDDMMEKNDIQYETEPDEVSIFDDENDESSLINDSIDFSDELGDFENLEDIEESYENEKDDNSQRSEIKSIEPTISYSMSNLNSLMTKDKKIVTFVGTSKNGVSFLVNNLAKIFASLRINTAILDMTKNKNSYYIYTDNQEELRQIAYSSITKLQKGVAEGIKVNQNLTVYTCRPNDGNDYSNAEDIYSTLVQNHSLVLVDCDFDTDPSFFANAQEMYLVQSMDVLTIQPLTSFLRDLLHKGVLEQEKIKIVINKELKVRELNSKKIIAGMSFYNDSTMSVLTELFNKDTVKYCCIPFDETAYAKYLNEIAEYKFSVKIKGYSKNFISKLQILAGMVYPLTSRKTYSNTKTNSYGTTSFSNDTNEILSKMKKKF